MKNCTVFIVLWLVCLVGVNAQTPFFHFYNHGNNWAKVVRKLPDSSGYVIFGSTASFAAKPFMIITDTLGNEVKYIIDTTSTLQFEDGYVDEGKNFYVAGNYGFPMLIKYDSSGQKLWQKTYPLDALVGGYSSFFKLIVRNDTVYAVGSIENASDSVSSGLYCVIDTSGSLLDSSEYRPPYPGAGCGAWDFTFLDDTSLALYGNCSYPGLITQKPYLQKINLNGDTLENLTVMGPNDSLQMDVGGIAKLNDGKIVICGGSAPSGIVTFYAPFYQVFDYQLQPLTTCVLDTFKPNYGASHIIVSDSNNLFSIGAYDTTIHESSFCRRIIYSSGQINFDWERTISSDNDVILSNLVINGNNPILCGYTTSELCYYCSFLTLTNEYDCFDLNCPFETDVKVINSKASSLNLYPNPCSQNTVHIQSRTTIRPGSVCMCDAMGRTIQLSDIRFTNQWECSFEFPSMLATGMYLINLQLLDGTKITTKMIRSD